MSRTSTLLVRTAGALALLALVGVCVSDFETTFWVDHAMFTAVLSAVLVAIVAGALVDSYLKPREHVNHLTDFVDLAGRVWKLTDELSREQLEHRMIPLGEDWGVVGRVSKLIETAARLEVEFDASAPDLARPDDWTSPPGWFVPGAERETTTAG